METEVAGLIGAERHERSGDRSAYRNGTRTRTWDTRVGTIELAIPKVRPGTYFPSLLQPRRRAEHALLAVVQEAYVHGVSTRKVDDLMKALGLDGMSKSEVSRICGELDTGSGCAKIGSAMTQLRKVAEGLRSRFARAAAVLEEAAEDILAYRHLPLEHQRQLHSTNPLERLNKEIKRRSNVVGIFPNPAAVIRLVGAILLEQDDERTVAERRYFSAESMKQTTTPTLSSTTQ